MLAWIVVLLFAALLFGALRFRVVGLHGGTFRREENPIGYWVGVFLIVVCVFGGVMVLTGLF
jgi:hypothetical protein